MIIVLLKKQRLLRLFPAPKQDIKGGIQIISPELEQFESRMVSADIHKGQRDYTLPPGIKNLAVLKFGLNK